MGPAGYREGAHCRMLSMRTLTKRLQEVGVLSVCVLV